MPSGDPPAAAGLGERAWRANIPRRARPSRAARAYQAGKRRIFVGAWKHGISVYGWGKDRNGGFTARHPGLVTSTGTIRLRPEDAASFSDEEFLALARAGLAR